MRKKNMTVGSLLEKLNILLLKGVVKSSTPVCGFADEFQHFYPLKRDAEIAVETAPWIKESMDFVKRHENGTMVWIAAIAGILFAFFYAENRWLEDNL